MKTDESQFPKNFFTASDKEIEEYLQQAIKQALKMHKAAGNPIAVWKDGKVVLIAPEDIKV
jgi:hypothetical protein